MTRVALALCCILTGCNYLGTAREWDPRTADDGFHLIQGLEPVRQADTNDCGPAALATVLRWDPLESTCRHASLSIL